MKHLTYVALFSALALLAPLSASAKDKNQHSVSISDSLQVSGTQLKPGDYKVEWQGNGPAVQVSFLQNGETVATAPATLKAIDGQVTQDEVVADTTDSNTRALKEIDFRRDKEALVFEQSGM
jgi:hypothetical protein